MTQGLRKVHHVSPSMDDDDDVDETSGVGMRTELLNCGLAEAIQKQNCGARIPFSDGDGHWLQETSWTSPRVESLGDW